MSLPRFQRTILIIVGILLFIIEVPSPARSRQVRSSSPQPPTARRIARQVLPSVVLIRVEGGCYGSGFFVTNDLIATNKHVLACGGRGTVSFAGSRRTFSITATWADPQHDLVLVRIADSSSSTRPLPLSPRGWPAVSDDIYVAGNPAQGWRAPSPRASSAACGAARG